MPRINDRLEYDLLFMRLHDKWGHHPWIKQRGLDLALSSPGNRQRALLKSLRYLEAHDGKAPLSGKERAQRWRDVAPNLEPPPGAAEAEKAIRFYYEDRRKRAAQRAPIADPKRSEASQRAAVTLRERRQAASTEVLRGMGVLPPKKPDAATPSGLEAAPKPDNDQVDHGSPGAPESAPGVT